jgi:hypothetical protein
MRVQPVESVELSHSAEELPELSIHYSLFAQLAPQTIHLNEQRTHSTKLVSSADNQNRNVDQVVQTPGLRHTPKLSQELQEWTLESCVFKSVICSRLSSRTTSQNPSVIRFLRLISRGVALLPVLLFSVLVHIGILYYSEYASNNVYTPSSTPDSKLTVHKVSSTCKKRYVPNFAPDAKTIAILRKLESFWIYTIA